MNSLCKKIQSLCKRIAFKIRKFQLNFRIAVYNIFTVKTKNKNTCKTKKFLLNLHEEIYQALYIRL